MEMSLYHQAPKKKSRRDDSTTAVPEEIFAIPAPSEVGKSMMCLCKRVYWIQDSSLLFIYSPIPKHEAIGIMSDSPKTINILKSGPSQQTNLLRSMNGSIYGVPQIIGPVNIQATKDKLLYKLTSGSNAFHVQQTAQPPSKSANISATIKRTEYRNATPPTAEISSLPKIESVFSLASNEKAADEVQAVVQTQYFHPGYRRNVTDTSILDRPVSEDTGDFEISAPIGQSQGLSQEVTNTRSIQDSLVSAETDDFEIFTPIGQPQGHTQDVANKRSKPDPFVSAETDDFEIFAPIGQPQGHTQNVTKRRSIPNPLEGVETEDFEICAPTGQPQGLSRAVTNRRSIPKPLDGTETDDFEISHLQELSYGRFNGYVWNGKGVGAGNPDAIRTMNYDMHANAEVQDLSCHKRNAHARNKDGTCRPFMNSRDITTSNKTTDSHNMTEIHTHNPSSSRHKTYVTNEGHGGASNLVDSSDISSGTATAREIHAYDQAQDLSGFRRVTNDAKVSINYPVNSPDSVDLYNSKDRNLRRFGSSDSGMESDQSSSSFEIDDPTTYYDNRRRKAEVTGESSKYGESPEIPVADMLTVQGANVQCAEIRDGCTETDALTQTDNGVIQCDDDNMLVNDDSLEEDANAKMMLNNASTQTDGQKEPYLYDRTGVVIGNEMDNAVNKDSSQSRTLNEVVDSLVIDGVWPGSLRTQFMNDATRSRSESSNLDKAVERTTSTVDTEENSVSNLPVDGYLETGHEKDETKANERDSQIQQPTIERLKLKLRWNKRWKIERASCPSPFDSDISQSNIHQPSHSALRYRMTDAELALYSPKIRHSGSKLTVVMKRKSPCLKLRRLHKDYLRCVEIQQHLKSSCQEIGKPLYT